MPALLVRLGACAALSFGALASPAPGAGPASPATLQGHVSFLASDLLAGRGTPSIGLDVAAEYIASQFRRIGLEPVGDDGYFQTADWEQQHREAGDLRVVLGAGPAAIAIDESHLAVIAAADALALERAPVATLDFGAPDDTIEAGAWAGRVVLTRLPSVTDIPRDQRREFFQKWQAFARIVQRSGAAAVVSLEPDSPPAGGVAGDVRRGLALPGAPTLRITGAPAQGILDAGDTTLSITLATARVRITPVRNVAGLLRGADPALAAEHVIVSAHYDHVGTGAGEGDTIFNGANDNASGTAGVIEAAALLAAGERPSRSVLFLCFYGEEMGLVGARHYADNPLLPLESAIANINLEQIGRTDDASGDVAKRILPTGAGFSTALDAINAGAAAHGVAMVTLTPQTTQYFRASDNVALAARGVPAHTICTAFAYPEYHGAGDHWNLLDYDNMSLIVRALADGVARLAGDAPRPEWIESDATRAFIAARNGAPPAPPGD